MRFAAAQNPGPLPLRKLLLPEPGKKILVTVSGGVDSMVLLYILKELSATQRWQLTIAHFNHCLRGRASDADEAFVCKTAAAMKLPFIAGRADVKSFARESKLSIEMAARKLRHEFFAKTARKWKARIIALAHHADDQVELFFLRLLRGTGGRSLAGMKWLSPSPADWKLLLIRPLLNFSKIELAQFARENKIRCREDATNISQDFLRNRIRHELLPLLRKNYQTALDKTILRLMDTVGAESDFVYDQARSWLSNGSNQNDFKKLPVAIQRQALRFQLTELRISVDFDLIESLRKTADQSVNASANFSVSRDEKGKVIIHRHPVAVFNDSQLKLKLNRPDEVIFDSTKLSWRFSKTGRSKGPFRENAKTGTEYFDGDRMRKDIILRHWQAGDRFCPIGLKTAVKLQDLFTNAKIPREQRHKLIIAETGGEIFWVEGLRISENFKLTPQTRELLIWCWRRQDSHHVSR